MLDNVVTDPSLFDKNKFDQLLSENSSALDTFKQILKKGDLYITDRFEQGKPIVALVKKRAWFIDQLLKRAWELNVSDNNLSLVAVGGYGRGELHPYSDIDLMILKPWRLKPGIKAEIENYIRFLWDIGLEVGHSVRTINECVRIAKADVTVTTNLMESRLLHGRTDLFETMHRKTGPNKIWPTRKYFERKWTEQVIRHQHFNDTDHNLEPNIKEGPGGLRDIQMIIWVAKRHFDGSDLADLVEHGFLTRKEYRILDDGCAFLWRVRFALHVIAGRREDRLLFDHQRKVAEKFGYKSEDNSAIEQFMKIYYHTIRELSRLNEMLLQHFQEAIIYARRKEKIIPINNRFQIRNNFIETRNKNTFKSHPFALLEIFLLKQQNPKIIGVRASTIRLIRESLVLIDDKFRKDIRNRSLFMEIIRQPRRVGHELRRMHRYGVLGSYMPDFAAIEGLMQFDLFHVYTVDEHILFVVQNMRKFTTDEYKEKFPLAWSLMKIIPKQELLYLSGIFHDIAKGQKTDHSKLGRKYALEFCRGHQLSEFDSRLVTWLVENHLLMSKTAQREDISDPAVINKFAVKVGDELHLNYLYLLTVADINGTDPKLWNSWKDALLIDLYENTLLALRRGLENPIDKKERIKDAKSQALNLISGKIDLQSKIQKIWSQFGDDYFIHNSPDEIAWHTRAIAKSHDGRLPLILIREMTARGGSEIFIYMHDHDNIFSRATKILDLLGLNIMDARIITAAAGYTLDTFIVLEEDGQKISGRERKKEIQAMLRENLTNFDIQNKKSSKIKSRKLKHFPIPTRVTFTADEKNKRTIMEVSATDRLGFLSAVGMAMEQNNINIQSAKIATYGERVEDIFFITDHNSKPIIAENILESLRVSITKSLKQI